MRACVCVLGGGQTFENEIINYTGHAWNGVERCVCVGGSVGPGFQDLRTVVLKTALLRITTYERKEEEEEEATRPASVTTCVVHLGGSSTAVGARHSFNPWEPAGTTAAVAAMVWRPRALFRVARKEGSVQVLEHVRVV